MTHKIKALWKSPTASEGSAAVEFALIAGLLFGILFSTVDLGLWAGYQNQVTAASRNAAIQYSISHSTSDASDIVFKAIMPSSVTFSVDTSDATSAGCYPGQLITSNVTYTASIGTGFLFILPMVKASSYAICQ
jgi:Flp pilus assembly protein TadG